jgi:hypothetical protein
MPDYQLRLTLLSDATFGRGDGVAGLVDAEVQHDELGLPYLAGRTLKGLLGAECADILFALERGRPEQSARWRTAETRLFGRSGAALEGHALLHVGAARLPDDLRQAIQEDIQRNRFKPVDVLEMLTAVRRQTAMDAWGAPLENTLRAMRVILRKTIFWASLCFAVAPTSDDLALLAACVKALRHAGTGRNRGRGRVQADLLSGGDTQVTEIHFADFRKAVME